MCSRCLPPWGTGTLLCMSSLLSISSPFGWWALSSYLSPCLIKCQYQNLWKSSLFKWNRISKTHHIITQIDIKIVWKILFWDQTSAFNWIWKEWLYYEVPNGANITKSVSLSFYSGFKQASTTCGLFIVVKLFACFSNYPTSRWPSWLLSNCPPDVLSPFKYLHQMIRHCG